MNDITPEQKKQLGSWASQRDFLLQDIANNRTENDKLIESNKSLAQSNTEIANKIQQSIGRLEELVNKEKERVMLIVPEIAELSKEKSVLQTQISDIRKEIILLTDKKSGILTDIENLSNIHNKIFNKINDFETILGKIVKISSDNATEINDILLNAGVELKKIIDINTINVEKTNVVIRDLPPIIFNLQRDIFDRKRNFNKHKVIE